MKFSTGLMYGNMLIANFSSSMQKNTAFDKILVEKGNEKWVSINRRIFQ